MRIRDWLIFLRWPNLLMVAVTQLVVWRVVLTPFIEYDLYTVPQLSRVHFVLLSLCTILVTAAGNVINDIHDRELDLINKPDKVFVGQKISVSGAYSVYWIFNLVGLTIAVFLAHEQNAWRFLPLFPLFTGLLWVYSRWLKGTVLIGNLLISLAVAAVAFLPLLAEWRTISWLDDQHTEFLYFYGLLAFLGNFLREIVKDAQDHDGDKSHGKNTLATQFGLKYSLLASRILLLFLWGIILYFCLKWNAYLALVPLLILLLLISFLLAKSVQKVNWKLASTWIKVLMLFGVVFLAFLF